MMFCLIFGKLGFGGRPAILFRPVASLYAERLEGGEGDHGHERVSVQLLPSPAFEVVDAKLFLKLLARLFADPAGLDGAGELLDRRVSG